MLDQLTKGSLDAGFYIPEGFTRNATSVFPTWIKAYVFYRDPSAVTVCKGVVEGFLAGFAREFAIRRAEIAIKYIELYGGNFSSPFPVLGLCRSR